MSFTPWTIQVNGVEGVMAAIAEGYRRIVLTSPTGTGKTWMMKELIRRFLSVGKKALLYTSRKVLLEQLQRDLAEISFGIRAAGYYPERHHDFQVASLPTDRARMKRENYEDHEADLVLIDEGHMHVKGPSDRKLLKRHHDRGAVLVYITATPIGMGLAADILVQAGFVSDGRKCGALVQARHFGPDEPAIRKNSKLSTITGLLDASEDERRDVMGRAGTEKCKKLFGRVLEWFDKLNKQRKPTLLFASGVPEARWFAQQFFEHGITAASVDGEEVWINGEQVVPDQGRDEVRNGSETGSIQVVCNRFVLREGADWPWLAHGIFATVFDSIQSYLQAGGRLLRSHPSAKTVCIQDHGGNWWRHGSLNEDRVWSLDYTARMLAGVREEAYRDGEAAPTERKEPYLCPLCALVLRSRKCLECGYEFPERERTRSVIQEDGTLVRITGKMFRPRQAILRLDTVEKWIKTYWQMKASKKPKSFTQAMGWFIRQHRYRPPRNLPLMPKDPFDWYRAIKSVSFDRLHPDPNYSGARSSTQPAKREKGLFDDAR